MKTKCPYCGCLECEADFVDIGVGLQQSGPYSCPKCYASEIESFDYFEEELWNKYTEEEKRCGWKR